MQLLPSQAFGFNPDTKLWLDGGHNEDAGRAISSTLKELQKDGKVTVILSMLQHKNPADFVKQFIDHCNALFITQLPNEPKSFSASNLSELLKEIPHKTAEAYKDALEQAKSQNPAHILITGSLYLAGHVLQDLEDIGHNKE